MENTEQQTIEPQAEFNFKLNINDIYLIGQGLGKLPYENVHELITKIQTAFQNNLSLLTEEKEKEKENI
jgi:hypothetical protein